MNRNHAHIVCVIVEFMMFCQKFASEWIKSSLILTFNSQLYPREVFQFFKFFTLPIQMKKAEQKRIDESLNAV